MTHVWIIAMYLSPLVVIGGFYVLSKVSFYIFVQIFGLVDNFIQNYHWKDLPANSKEAA